MPHSLLHHQPLKTLYLAYEFFATVFFRIPFWTIWALPKSLRPRPSWTVKRTVLVKLLRHTLVVTDRSGPITKVPNHLAITPGVGVNGVWVEPVPELVTGVLKTWTIASSVSTVRVPGYWIHKKGSPIGVGSTPKPGEKVLYLLHGGGYVGRSAHPNDAPANICRGVLEHVDSVHRTFALEYRLSSSKPFPIAHPFPAALLDALAGYNYLVNVVGFAPADIIVAGDSAGGNLAHALTRYLVEYKDTSDARLPAPPGALLLLSPWTDMGMSHDTPDGSAFTLVHSDFLGAPASFGYAKDSFLGPHGMGAASNNRYISPASLHPSMSIDFKGFPRTFITAGGAEVFVDQIRTFKDRIARDLGVGDGVKPGDGLVRYCEVPDGVHDYLVFTWHEPERTETLKEIARWVDTQ